MYPRMDLALSKSYFSGKEFNILLEEVEPDAEEVREEADINKFYPELLAAFARGNRDQLEDCLLYTSIYHTKVDIMDKVCGHGNVSAVAGGDHGADYGRQDHGGHGGGKAREQQRGKYIFSGNTGKQSAPVHAQHWRNECDRDQCCLLYTSLFSFSSFTGGSFPFPLRGGNSLLLHHQVKISFRNSRFL